LKTRCQWHCSAISDSTEPNPPEANSRSGDKPDGDPELVGDRRDIEREFPLLVEPEEVYLCQVGDPAAGGDGVVHHGLAGEREERLGHVQRQRPEPRPFGGAADHDDGDDALLGAGHGSALLCSARRRWRSGRGTGERARAGKGAARFMATGFGVGRERGPRDF
jgi:hypothetical protein